MHIYNSYKDEELLALLKGSDEAAFQEIYNRYSNLLLHTAYHILEDKETVQDVVQNIFISLWQRRLDVQIDRLKSYLQQATRFAVFKAIREMKHTAAFYERLAKITADIITDNPLLFKEQQHLIQQMIDTLPEHCREVFLLSRDENMTYKQIAELLGISEKTVEKRISQSLRFIRSGLTAYLTIVIFTAL